MRARSFLLAFGFCAACSAAREHETQLLNDGGSTEASSGSPSEGGFEPVVDGSSPEPAPVNADDDKDGDGYPAKDDCNDANREVNPGAYEVVGDGVDNDCNGKIDEADDCDETTSPALLESMDAMQFAKALGLCRVATKDGSGKDKTWGVISAALVAADGSPLKSKQAIQHGIFSKFGTLSPRAGKNMVVLSSGTARTPDQPGWVKPRDIGGSFTTDSAVTPPAGHPQNTTGCPEPITKMANDSVNLKLVIRVPTNANSFRFDFDFFSSEYSTFLCSSFNDSFVAILDGKAPLDAKNAKNISFDSKGGPVNVNSGFFEVCTPGTFSGRSYPCARGTGELVGTGFFDSAAPWNCGATSWLQTTAPVVPGEEITLQFMIWDTSDHILDSTILLDAWKWDAKPTSAPVTDRPK